MANIKSMMDAKTVMAMMVFIGNGATVATCATKFKRSASAINGIIAGAGYTEITGLSKKDGKCGIAYVRANKDMFIVKAGSTPVNTDSQKKDTTSIVPTTKSSDAPTSPVMVGGLDLTSSMDTIKGETDSAMAKIAERKEALANIFADANAEMETLDAQESTLVKMQDVFKA